MEVVAVLGLFFLFIMAVLIGKGVEALKSIAKSMRTLVERERNQNLHDLAVVTERREEKTIDMDEMKRRLKEDKQDGPMP